MTAPSRKDASATLERLREEQNPLFVVLEQMHDGVLIGDNSRHLIWFNDALADQLDLRSGDLGQPCDAVLKSPELAGEIDRVMQTRQNAAFELSLRQGNLLKVFQVHIMPLRESSEFVALFHDLTEMRRTEKMRRDFVANVSHELRTPLTAIRGYAETLLDGALEDKAVAGNFVEIIYSHSNRLSQLVTDLLDLSKLESPDFKPELKPTDLAPILQQALSVIESNAHGKEVVVHVHLPAEPPKVLADGSNLEQVFTNLLDNAVKYTPEKGSVSVAVEDRGDEMILVRISDTGIGIEPKHIPRLFERFYRVDKARSRDLGGTGLGLSIVKHIVQYHGGDIWVDSILNEGSTFSFTLPKA